MSYFIKYFVFSVNFVYFILGAVASGLGVWALSLDMPEFIRIGAYGVLVVGVVVELSSFLGCSGVACQNTNRASFMLHVIFLAGLIALQAYLIYQCFKLNPINLEKDVYQELKKSFSGGRKKDYHNIEKTIKCCGVNETGGRDYPPDSVPSVCCQDIHQNTICNASNAYPSCTKVITNHMVQYARPFAYGMMGVCALQIFMLFGACTITHRNKGVGNLYEIHA